MKYHGYKSRKHYLECLSKKFNVPYETVVDWATRLGKEEDFKGLVDALEDYVDDEYNKVF